MVIRENAKPTKRPNQSNPHTLGVCMNCVEALGSLFYTYHTYENFPGKYPNFLFLA